MEHATVELLDRPHHKIKFVKANHLIKSSRPLVGEKTVTMWMAGSSEWLARGACRAQREITQRHRRRILSETDAAASSATCTASGLRSLLHTNNTIAEPHSAVIAANSNVFAVNSTYATADAVQVPSWTATDPEEGLPRASTSMFSAAAARVRAIAAAFEGTRAGSQTPCSPKSAAALQLDDCSDTEADAAVLIASRCVKQLTDQWETYSAGGSVSTSECSSPFAAGLNQQQKPVHRPLTPAAAVTVPSNLASPPASPCAAASTGAELGASVAVSRAASDPASAALLCWRQASGQLGPLLDLLMPAQAKELQPAEALGVATAGDSLRGPVLQGSSSLCVGYVPAAAEAAAEAAAAPPAAPSEEWGSVVCRAAVWAGLVSVFGVDWECQGVIWRRLCIHWV